MQPKTPAEVIATGISARAATSDCSYCSKPLLQHQFSATRIRAQAIGLGVCPGGWCPALQKPEVECRNRTRCPPVLNRALSGEHHIQAAESRRRTVSSFGSMTPRFLTTLKLPLCACAIYM